MADDDDRIDVGEPALHHTLVHRAEECGIHPLLFRRPDDPSVVNIRRTGTARLRFSLKSGCSGEGQ
jgi:hypothetical protein